MAGSKRWFTYTDDGGTNYAVQLDESNSEAVFSPGGAAFGAFSGGGLLPGLLKMRYANCQQVVAAGEIRRRKLWIATAATFTVIAQAAGTVTVTIANEGTWQVTSLRGEKRPLPTAADTGLTDGDNP